RKLFGTPLRVVSDDDKALLKAIREVFPRVPLQYCHSHFLRNLGEDLMGEHHRRVAEAAEEAKNLALAAVKRLGCGELELLVEGYLTVRGRFPFDAPALELYTRLRNLTAEVLSLRVKSQNLTRLKTSFMKAHATLLRAREASEILNLLFTAFGFLRLALADENPEERVRETAAWAESLGEALREELRPSPRGSRYEERLHTHTGIGGCPRSITELERRFGEAGRTPGTSEHTPKPSSSKPPGAPHHEHLQRPPEGGAGQGGGNKEEDPDPREGEERPRLGPEENQGAPQRTRQAGVTPERGGEPTTRSRPPSKRRHFRGRREAGPEPLRVPAETQTRHQPDAAPRNHPRNSPTKPTTPHFEKLWVESFFEQKFYIERGQMFSQLLLKVD
ncbi:MAG: transposase, partial [Candidatus Freyrarchaeum guaymaensis]